MRPWAVRRYKALGVSWRLEAPYAPFSLTCRRMRLLGAVVQIPMLAVLQTWEELPLGYAVALELIRDDHARDVLTPFEQLTEERLRIRLVAMALNQDIQHIPVLIDRPPVRVPFAIDGEEDFIQMPRIARSRTPASQLVRILLPKLLAPVPQGFMRQGDTTFRYQLLDIALAQAEVTNNQTQWLMISARN